MTDFSRARGAFDIGRVFNRTLGAARANLGVFFGLVVSLTGLPLCARGLYQGAPDLATELFGTGILVPSLIGFLSTFSLFSLQGAVVHGSLLQMHGRRAGFRDCLKTVVRQTFPVIALNLLTMLGLAAGLALLVVPAVLFLAAFAVVVPVRVAEGRRLFECFPRSAALTKGNRWKILAVIGVYFALSWIFIEVGSLALIGASTLLGGAREVTAGSLQALVLSCLLFPLLESMSVIGGAAVTAAVYYELRSIREGLVPDDLASVFD
jgi:hypothetical protein